MRSLAIAVLALALRSSAGAAETPVKTKSPAAAIAALVRFTAPKGWTPSEYSNSQGADPVARFENLSDAITVKAYGAPGSAYASPEAFLSGPAATSQGVPATKEGTVEIAGSALALYRRRFPVNVPDPHGPPAPLMLGSELFVVLPPASGGRFIVLSSVHSSPIPDLERGGEKAWAAFLKTVKPAAKAKTKPAR